MYSFCSLFDGISRGNNTENMFGTVFGAQDFTQKIVCVKPVKNNNVFCVIYMEICDSLTIIKYCDNCHVLWQAVFKSLK